MNHDRVVLERTLENSDIQDTEEVFHRVFDESNVNWIKDVDHNRMFLIAQQNYFNYLLKARGHVFLNEVFDGIGLSRTTKGQLIGWRNIEIDFGIPIDVDFHAPIILKFNVEGEIYKTLDEEN